MIDEIKSRIIKYMERSQQSISSRGLAKKIEAKK